MGCQRGIGGGLAVRVHPDTAPGQKQERGGDVLVALEMAWESNEDVAAPFDAGAVPRCAHANGAAQLPVACLVPNVQGGGWRERHTA